MAAENGFMAGKVFYLLYLNCQFFHPITFEMGYQQNLFTIDRFHVFFVCFPFVINLMNLFVLFQLCQRQRVFISRY